MGILFLLWALSLLYLEHRSCLQNVAVADKFQRTGVLGQNLADHAGGLPHLNQRACSMLYDTVRLLYRCVLFGEMAAQVRMKTVEGGGATRLGVVPSHAVLT